MKTLRKRINEQNKILTESKSFVDIMKSLNGEIRSVVVKDLSELTDTCTWQINYAWANGQSKPPMIKQRAIARYMNRSIEVLFPN